jgi:DNA transposition AAA+ family ATPase
MADESFIVTKEYRRFAEFCDACRRDRYIGLCFGPPGVGKTLSAQRYARWDVVGPQVRDYVIGSGSWPEAASARSVVYTPTVANTPRRVEKELGNLLTRLTMLVDDHVNPEDPVRRLSELDYVELVLVDEADRLRMAGLEQVRDDYDRHGWGLVLIGMPGLERRLSRYPQLYSRIGFVHHYRPLGADELLFVLQRQWESLGLRLSPEDFTDSETIAAIARITGGNFRLVRRLLAQVERILEINKP